MGKTLKQNSKAVIVILVLSAFTIFTIIEFTFADSDSADSTIVSHNQEDDASFGKWGDFNGDGVISALDTEYRDCFFKRCREIRIPSSETGRIGLQSLDTSGVFNPLKPRLITFDDASMPRSETFTKSATLKIKSILIERDNLTVTFLLAFSHKYAFDLRIGMGSVLVDNQGRSLSILRGPNTGSALYLKRDHIHVIPLTFESTPDGSDILFLEKIVIDFYDDGNRSFEFGTIELPRESTLAARVQPKTLSSDQADHPITNDKVVALIQPIQPRFVTFRNRIYHGADNGRLGITVNSVLVDRDSIVVNLSITATRRGGFDLMISGRTELIVNHGRRLKLKSVPGMDEVKNYPRLENQKVKMIFDAPRNEGEIWWIENLRICDSPETGLVYEFDRIGVPLKSSGTEIVEIL